MGMKSDLSAQGKSTDWGCLRTVPWGWGGVMGWRKLSSEELHNLYPSLRVFKPRSKGKHHACDRGEIHTYLFVWKPKQKDHFGDLSIDGRVRLKGTRCVGVDCIQVAQDGVEWWGPVGMVLPMPVDKTALRPHWWTRHKNSVFSMCNHMAGTMAGNLWKLECYESAWQ
jgi:hypothetical protein